MDKVILAKNVVLDGGLGAGRPNDNQMIFGGGGTCKSMSIVLPTLCHMKESSLIGIFAKRSVVSNAVAFFKKLKYKTYVWNLANPEKKDSIPDPLSYISSDDVQEVAHQIANGNPEYQRATKFDPYWRDASEGLITGLIYYIFMTEEKPSMKKVIDFFYKLKIEEDGKGISTTLDGQFAWLGSKGPDSIAARKLRSFAQLPYTTAGCVWDDLEKSIQNMFPVSIQNAMNEDAYVGFEDFATNRTAIFIITSQVRTAQYGFANLLFGIAIRQLMEFAETQENNRLPRDVKLFLMILAVDSTFKTMKNQFQPLELPASAVSLSQLDATYGQDNSTVILDNCSSLVYFPGGMNKKTCSYISEMINLPLEDIMFMEMGNVVVFQSEKTTHHTEI